MAQESRRRGAPVFGLLLMAAGVLLLLQTLGVLPWALWLHLWRLWPLLLVIAGVNLLLGRRAPWLAAGVIAVLLVGAFALASYRSNGFFNDIVKVQQLSEPLGDARFLTATLGFGAGDIKLNALPPGSASLVEGAFRGGSNGVNSSVDRAGDRVSLRLERQGPRWFFIGSVKEEWDVSLSPAVAIELTINAGASAIEADLGALNVTNLRLSAGASNVEVTLPAEAEHTFARMDVGAANLTVRVPEGVAARVKTDTGVASVDVDEARFPRTGDYYQSPDYDSARHRVEVEIKGGVADITVR